MKKVLLIVLVVLLLGGGAAYLLTKDDKNDQTPTNTESQPTTDTSSEPTASFSPLSTEGKDFVATVTTTTKTGTSTAKFEQDGTKTRYTISTSNTNSQFIYTKDTYYVCGSGQCYKYTAKQSNSSGVDVKNYQYSGSELSSFKNSAAYKGKQSCPAGTCDVWSVTAGGITSTLYLDDQQRISQVESSQAGTTTKITYEYKDVTISLPTNAKSPTTSF